MKRGLLIQNCPKKSCYSWLIVRSWAHKSKVLTTQLFKTLFTLVLVHLYKFFLANCFFSLLVSFSKNFVGVKTRTSFINQSNFILENSTTFEIFFRRFRLRLHCVFLINLKRAGRLQLSGLITARRADYGLIVPCKVRHTVLCCN